MADIIQRVIDASACGDHYAVLGVAPQRHDGATKADAMRRCLVLKGLPLSAVKSAYVAMSLACHPDKCKHEKATDAQQLVNKAWSILRDDSSRKAFDRNLKEMTELEYDRKQKEELKTQKQNQTVITPRMMQQSKAGSEQKKDSEQKKCSKPDTQKQAEQKTKPSEASSKSWDVANCTLKELKVAISVKLSSHLNRKFLFKEWQDKDVARTIAEEFAKQVLTITNQFDCLKLKKDKSDFAYKHGVDVSGKETVSMLLAQLEQA